MKENLLSECITRGSICYCQPKLICS